MKVKAAAVGKVDKWPAAVAISAEAANAFVAAVAAEISTVIVVRVPNPFKAVI